MVATALSMVLMYIVVGLIYLARAGSGTAFAAFADDSGAGAATSVGNYLMKGVTEGLSFGVAVAVIPSASARSWRTSSRRSRASPNAWCPAPSRHWTRPSSSPTPRTPC